MWCTLRQVRAVSVWCIADHAAEIAQQLQNRVIEDKLILGNLLKVPDLHERGQSIMEVLAAIARHAYDAHTSNV
ncbi:MAG: hypothetical protein UY90_C0087G0005 [Candidatus Peregrinibacteria bacterium GW2011_GWA2_54_9]|nr:MAG: hypothetical protein UY90_C0087G0005 [Candidatus Peregrinibacteria bacterium GW2011_GWA2_54_9]